MSQCSYAYVVLKEMIGCVVLIVMLLSCRSTRRRENVRKPVTSDDMSTVTNKVYIHHCLRSYSIPSTVYD